MENVGTATTVTLDECAQIAAGLRRRDIALLQTLVERLQYRLIRYLIYLLGRREGVDDLVQETWLRVLERGASYDGRSRFEPWLFAIARHLVIDQSRRRVPLSLDSSEDDDAWIAPAAICASPSPFVLAARSEVAARLSVALQNLSSATREALLLRFQEELSLLEISGIVGAPVSTVASRIHRGLATLRGQMGGEE